MSGDNDGSKREERRQGLFPLQDSSREQESPRRRQEIRPLHALGIMHPDKTKKSPSFVHWCEAGGLELHKKIFAVGSVRLLRYALQKKFEIEFLPPYRYILQ